MYEARIRAIVEKLAELQRKPGTEGWFGVEKHHFRLNAPLAEAELEAFEKRHGVRLPEDYRQFLLLAGNGGAGPYYGLGALVEFDEWFEEEDAEPGFVASPCPFVYEQVTSAAWREYLPEDRSDWGRGSIHICEQGCTYTARLVVSGASRGRVFNFDASHGPAPPYFVRDKNFIDWYERWVDEARAGEPAWDFGFDNPDYDAVRAEQARPLPGERRLI